MRSTPRNIFINYKFILIGLLLFVVDVLMMTFFTPQQVGALGIVFWFIVLTLGIFFFTLGWFKKHTQNIYRRTGIFSLTIVVLLALQSLHQLSLRDIVLIIVLAGLVEFYLTKSDNHDFR